MHLYSQLLGRLNTVDEWFQGVMKTGWLNRYGGLLWGHENGTRYRLHDVVNVLVATELFTLKWLIVII